MQHQICEIARNLAPKAHVTVMLDQAGWHTTGRLRVPENLSLLPLPSKLPELNPTENVWQFPRPTKLSNRVFGGYEAIVEAACEAWNSLIARSRPHHLNRNPPVGDHRSPLTALGIRCALHLQTTFFL
jgi:hypothetical protein